MPNGGRGDTGQRGAVLVESPALSKRAVYLYIFLLSLKILEILLSFYIFVDNHAPIMRVFSVVEVPLNLQIPFVSYQV